MQMKRFPQSKRFRVIIGDACFYATAKQIRYGVGDLGKCNAALQKALETLEFQRMSDQRGMKSMGLAGTWEGLQVQLTVS
jgi:hypothetical protein